MSLSSEHARTQIESPIVPVQHVSDLIDLDPHSELFLETPPPDVVSSINACFEQFTSTLERRRNVSVPKSSSDSESGESLFITQSVQTDRQHSRSTKRPESISGDIGDDREGVIDRLPEEEDAEYEEGSEVQHTVSPNKGKRIDYLPPRKATFPFILKLHRRRHLPMKKHQILENSEIGGFLKCIKKIQEGYVKTGRAISPFMLESEPSDNSEGGDHISDHEVTKVDKTIFLPSYYKANKLKWLPQSILENRTQDSLSKGQKDNEEQLLAVNGKEKKKTKSIYKNKTNASVKQRSMKKCKVSKSKAIVRTLSESRCLSLSKENEKQHEMREVLASCSESEDSDLSNCRQPLRQIIECTENSHGNNLVVIEETQGHSVESASGMNQEDGIRSGTDNYLPNKNNFYFLPRSVGLSVQNEIQQTDSDNGSVDLFMPLKSQKHDNNENHKTLSITADMEESNQDSDVPQMEAEGKFDSIFEPGTPKLCEGEHYAHEDSDSDITQIETEGVHVSVFKPRRSTKLFATQDLNRTKYSESQKTGQSPVAPHPELLSREDKTGHKNKKRKSMSSSQNDTELKGIKAGNVQPSSKHLPVTDEPLREVYSISCKQRTMVERETNSQRSPSFKNGGKSFLKRKRKMDATILVECDKNVDLSQKVSSVDATEIEMENGENGELCNMENRVTNEQRAELSKKSLSTVADSSVIKKTKRKKMKMYKLKEREDPDPGVENQLVEVVQFIEPQTTELTLKIKKKKRKDKERTKTAYVEEISATDIPSCENLEWNQSSEIPEAGQPKLMQTEEITGCPMLDVNVSRFKSRKKKKRNVTEESQFDLDASSKSPFDAGLKVVEQHEDQVIEETWSDDNAAEHLKDVESIIKVAKHKKSHNVGSEGITRCPSPCITKLSSRKKKRDRSDECPSDSVDLNFDASSLSLYDVTGQRAQKMIERKQSNAADQCYAPHILNVAKRKKKSQNAISPSQVDDVIGLENAVLDLGSVNTAESVEKTNSSVLSDMLSSKYKRNKKKKKHKLKEQVDAETNFVTHSVDNVCSVEPEQFNESQTTELTLKRTKKKRKHKEIFACVEENSATDILSNETFEAAETDRPEHLQTLEQIGQYPSPNVIRLKSVKMKNRSEECQYESVDLNLDVSSVSQFDVTGLRAQKMIERKQENAAEQCYAAQMVNVAKHKKKSQNASYPSQVDDLIELENAVLDSESANTAEHVQKTNSSVLSDNMSSKHKRKKKKKHKLKEQVDAETNSLTHSVDNVHSVEPEQFNESQTTELTLKRTKKKRKHKEIFACVEENSATDNLSNETFEAAETDRPEHLQTLEQIGQYPSPNVITLKSVKRKNRSEECQYESVDLNLDVSSVSQFDVTGVRAQKMIERKQSNAAEQCYAAHILNVAKRKKKSLNASSPYRIDDLVGLKNPVLDPQSGNTAECVEKANSSGLSDNLSSKHKQHKKKKHKLKEQVNAETNSVTHSVDNVHSFELEQSNESQTTELTLKRTKKKRKHKEIFEHVEENSATDILSK